MQRKKKSMYHLKIFNRSIIYMDGEGNGAPLQYSCLTNPMERGAWWAAVHGVARSRTQLSDFPSVYMEKVQIKVCNSIIIIIIFLAVLSLLCCLGFSLVVASGGCSRVAVCSLLCIAVASLVSKHRL